MLKALGHSKSNVGFPYKQTRHNISESRRQLLGYFTFPSRYYEELKIDSFNNTAYGGISLTHKLMY